MKRLLVILVVLVVVGGCIYAGKFAGSHATASVLYKYADARSLGALGPIGKALGK